MTRPTLEAERLALYEQIDAAQKRIDQIGDALEDSFRWAPNPYGEGWLLLPYGETAATAMLSPLPSGLWASLYAPSCEQKTGTRDEVVAFLRVRFAGRYFPEVPE